MNRLREVYNNEIVKDLKEKYGYKSTMAVPKLEKIVINIGVGDAWKYYRSRSSYSCI